MKKLPRLPSGIPEVPDGYVYVGKGNKELSKLNLRGGLLMNVSYDTWENGLGESSVGHVTHYHYCVKEEDIGQVLGLPELPPGVPPPPKGYLFLGNPNELPRDLDRPFNGFFYNSDSWEQRTGLRGHASACSYYALPIDWFVNRKERYEDLVAEAGIKVGDTVRVLFKAHHGHLNWLDYWDNSPMDATVGKSYKVGGIGSFGVVLQIGDQSYVYPFHCLQKVQTALDVLISKGLIGEQPVRLSDAGAEKVLYSCQILKNFGTPGLAFTSPTGRIIPLAEL